MSTLTRISFVSKQSLSLAPLKTSLGMTAEQKKLQREIVDAISGYKGYEQLTSITS